MSKERPTLDDLFDRRLSYPDQDAARRFARLIGIDAAKSRLTKLLAVLVNPAGPKDWAARHHPHASTLVDYLGRRPPLVLLAGDVGTGKTELAETVGDGVARQERIDVTLYPLSLATRGSGMVGEMTTLVSAAFEATLQAAERLAKSHGKRANGAVILLIDEGDALVESRGTAHMHHEDRAGVNAFIRGIDRLAERRLPAAVILCTNRLSAIDPAVQRRAADVFEFKRPTEAQRRAILEPLITEAGFRPQDVERLVQRTAGLNGIGFTFSDLTQRFLPTLVLDAYPDRALTIDRALQILDELTPTPPFREGTSSVGVHGNGDSSR
jgi:AAA+ superfamily predicted ATPase